LFINRAQNSICFIAEAGLISLLRRERKHVERVDRQWGWGKARGGTLVVQDVRGVHPLDGRRAAEEVRGEAAA
jgi:hypothetical protein